jgi:hypothetical protein
MKLASALKKLGRRTEVYLVPDARYLLLAFACAGDPEDL